VAGGESRLAIGVIGAMVEIDGEWTDAIAGKPAPTSDLVHNIHSLWERACSR
jgi:hypothetical protein